MWRRRRSRLIAVVAAATLALAGCATSEEVDPAGPSNAHCDAELIVPFGCHDFQLLPGRVRAWFDTVRGVRLVVEAPQGRLLIPVTVKLGLGTTAPLALDGPTAEDCGGDAACAEDVALRLFFARVVRLQPNDVGMRLAVRSNELAGVRLGTTTSYFPVRALRTGAFTALAADVANDERKVLDGALGYDALGCATVDGTVVVLPPRSVVGADGAVTIGDERFEVGDRMVLGGSLLAVPPDDWRCGGTAPTWFGGTVEAGASSR